MSGSHLSSTEPNPSDLYLNYQRNIQWRDRLHKRLAHKSFDIPEEEDMYVDNSQKGLSGKAVLGIALAAAMAAGVPGAGIAYFALDAMKSMKGGDQSISEPVDSSYQVLFYDKDGKPIQLPQRGGN